MIRVSADSMGRVVIENRNRVRCVFVADREDASMAEAVAIEPGASLSVVGPVVVRDPVGSEPEGMEDEPL